MIPIKLPREDKDRIIEAFIAFYQDERSEELGHIGAEQIIDFLLKETAPYVYNKALADARQVIAQKTASLEEELYAMEKRT